MREAVSGGTAFGVPKTAPPGRAARLGLTETDPAARFAPTLPFLFFRLGDTQTFGAELVGRPDGLGALVVEFTAGEQVGGYGGSVGGWTTYPYHVAAVELGFVVPWFAVAQRRVSQPSHKLYPDNRAVDLGTPDRRTNRMYALHIDPVAPIGEHTVAPLRPWLPGALAPRVEGRPTVAIEVSGGWALAAVQSRGLAVPDSVAANRQQRGLPGPWPDALLAMLRDLRSVLAAA